MRSLHKTVQTINHTNIIVFSFWAFFEGYNLCVIRPSLSKRSFFNVIGLLFIWIYWIIPDSCRNVGLHASDKTFM